MDPPVVTIRLGPKALGPMPPDLITPCGAVLGSHLSLSEGVEAPKAVGLAPGREGLSPRGGSCRPCVLKGRSPLART
jgi:hypothetical protein